MDGRAAPRRVSMAFIHNDTAGRMGWPPPVRQIMVLHEFFFARRCCTSQHVAQRATEGLSKSNDTFNFLSCHVPVLRISCYERVCWLCH